MHDIFDCAQIEKLKKKTKTKIKSKKQKRIKMLLHDYKRIF